MMRRISMSARDELVAVVADRYARGDRGERGRILDEFAAVTGYHRKHAMRLLRAGRAGRGGEASSLCGNRQVPANGTQSAVGPAVGSSTGTQLHPAESPPEGRLMTGPKWWRHSALIREHQASTCAGVGLGW